MEVQTRIELHRETVVQVDVLLGCLGSAKCTAQCDRTLVEIPVGARVAVDENRWYLCQQTGVMGSGLVSSMFSDRGD